MNNSSKNLPEAITLVDRISDLPEELLCHILSFLGTKQAVATSFLSKRWEFLWTHVDILELTNSQDDGNMQYMQFVRRVLELHKSPLIKMMELIFVGLFHTDCDDRITIEIALSSKNVRSLHLPFNNSYDKWPLNNFYSETIVELKLGYADITNIMDSPTAPIFPNLKKLRLYEPKVNNDSLNRFFAGCLILEDFHLQFKDQRYFIGGCYISSATLKTVDVCNVPMIVLNTPAVEVLNIWVPSNLELLVESSMPSLHKACISSCLYDLRFLKFLSNVSVLCLEVMKSIPALILLDLPVHFHNLTELEITAPPICLHLLRCFMEKSNNLQVIILKERRACYKYNATIWKKPGHVPKCLLSSLQTICIEGYKNDVEVALMIMYVLGNAEVLKSIKIFGAIWVEPRDVPKFLLSSLRTMCIKIYDKKEEFEVDKMIKYVLANAKVLENMEIHCSDKFKNNDKYKLRRLQKISKFPKASEICKLTILNSSD